MQPLALTETIARLKFFNTAVSSNGLRMMKTNLTANYRGVSFNSGGKSCNQRNIVLLEMRCMRPLPLFTLWSNSRTVICHLPHVETLLPFLCSYPFCQRASFQLERQRYRPIHHSVMHSSCKSFSPSAPPSNYLYGKSDRQVGLLKTKTGSVVGSTAKAAVAAVVAGAAEAEADAA